VRSRLLHLHLTARGRFAVQVRCLHCVLALVQVEEVLYLQLVSAGHLVALYLVSSTVGQLARAFQPAHNGSRLRSEHAAQTESGAFVHRLSTKQRLYEPRLLPILCQQSSLNRHQIGECLCAVCAVCAVCTVCAVCAVCALCVSTSECLLCKRVAGARGWCEPRVRAGEHRAVCW